MTAVRATATVSPLMASSNSLVLSRAFSGGTATFQPACPVVRSICWRWVQREDSEVLSLTATTSLPFADGAGGTPHSEVWSGNFHFSRPSATRVAGEPVVDRTDHGVAHPPRPVLRGPRPGDLRSGGRAARPGPRPAGCRRSGRRCLLPWPPPGPLPSPWSTEGDRKGLGLGLRGLAGAAQCEGEVVRAATDQEQGGEQRRDGDHPPSATDGPDRPDGPAPASPAGYVGGTVAGRGRGGAGACGSNGAGGGPPKPAGGCSSGSGRGPEVGPVMGEVWPVQGQF